MLAAVIREVGGTPTIDEVPLPEIGTTELLIAVAVAGVNHRDTLEIAGNAAGGRQPPFVVGVEGVGRVVAAGSATRGFRRGDRVGWVYPSGSFAQATAVPHTRAISLPDGINDATAAATLMHGLTARYLVASCAPVRRGTTVLVHPGSGGVGRLVTRMASLRGGRVIATIRNAGYAEQAYADGASAVADSASYTETVLEQTRGTGVDIVFDGLGGRLEASLACLAPRGHLVVYGNLSGQTAPIQIATLAARSLSVTRPSTAHYLSDAGSLRRHAKALFDLIEAEALVPVIAHRYPLYATQAALDDLREGAVHGKLLIELPRLAL